MCRVLLLALGAASVALMGCRENTRPLPIEERHDLLAEAVQGAGSPELVLLREGSGPARIFPAGMEASDPSPSPDGLSILFVVADYTQHIGDIWVANRDGSDARQLTFAPELDDQPSWSPDGHSIVFRSYRTGRDGDIWIMSASGANPRNLTPDPLPGVTDESRPAWSPGANHIAYASDAGGNRDIWIMNPDGSDKWQLTETADLDTEPSWGPGTQELAFRRCSAAFGCDIWVIPFGVGQTARRIARAGEQRLPAWSPDGSTIAFIEGPPSGSASLWTMAPDGSGAVPRLTDPAWGDPINPAWIRRAVGASGRKATR